MRFCCCMIAIKLILQVGEEQEFEDIDPLDQASVETGKEIFFLIIFYY